MILEQISDLDHLPSIHQPGVCEVWAIDKENGNGIPDWLTACANASPGSFPILITEDMVDTGSQWLYINKKFPFSLELTEEEALSSNGKTFNYQLLFSLNNDNWEARGRIIEAFENREWILMVRFANGTYRIIGDIKRGADFSAQLTTGKIGTGKLGYGCGFAWTSFHRALYAQPE